MPHTNSIDWFYLSSLYRLLLVEEEPSFIFPYFFIFKADIRFICDCGKLEKPSNCSLYQLNYSRVFIIALPFGLSWGNRVLRAQLIRIQNESGDYFRKNKNLLSKDNPSNLDFIFWLNACFRLFVHHKWGTWKGELGYNS